MKRRWKGTLAIQTLGKSGRMTNEDRAVRWWTRALSYRKACYIAITFEERWACGRSNRMAFWDRAEVGTIGNRVCFGCNSGS